MGVAPAPRLQGVSKVRSSQQRIGNGYGADCVVRIVASVGKELEVCAEGERLEIRGQD